MINIFDQIKKRKALRKILGNTGWLISEKVIQLGIGLLVNILVARYLGPAKYGMLSYTFSVVAFLGTFVYLGLSGLVVREIVRQPDEKETLLGSTFFLKCVGSIVAFLIVISVVVFTQNIGDDEFWVMLIIGLSLFAGPFEVIDFWFQSQVQSKYSVIARTSAFVLSSAIKVLCVFISTSVIVIAIVSSSQIILASFFGVLIYNYKCFSMFIWKVRV